MLAHQRSIAVWANLEPSGATSWSNTPSWSLIPTGDNIIPPASQRFMAGRIGARTTEVAASHAVLISQSVAVTDAIVAAATGS